MPGYECQFGTNLTSYLVIQVDHLNFLYVCNPAVRELITAQANPLRSTYMDTCFMGFGRGASRSQA